MLAAVGHPRQPSNRPRTILKYNRDIYFTKFPHNVRLNSPKPLQRLLMTTSMTTEALSVSCRRLRLNYTSKWKKLNQPTKFILQPGLPSAHSHPKDWPHENSGTLGCVASPPWMIDGPSILRLTGERVSPRDMRI